MRQQKHEPQPGQMQIDWTRGKRKTWIERMIIGPFEYVNSRGRRQKVCVTGRMNHLLLVLERFARDGGPCFLRIKTIQSRMGFSKNTVTRTIAACVGRGLLTVETNHDGTGENSSRYQIVWDEVGQVILDHPETAGLIDPTARAKASVEQSPGHTSVVCVGHTNSEGGHTKGGLGHTKLDGGHTNLDGGHTKVGVTDTLYPGEREHARSLNHVLNHRIKPCADASTNDATDGQTESQSNSRTVSPAGGWPSPLSVEDFATRARVDRLWKHALDRGYVTEADRGRFFALADHVRQLVLSGAEINNPGAYFTARLSKKHWLPEVESTVTARPDTRPRARPVTTFMRPEGIS